MADTSTVTYSFTLPEIGGSDDTWGVKLNDNWSDLDTLLKNSFTGGSASTIGKLNTTSAEMATTAEAQSGTSTVRFMSPATAKEAINVFGPPVGSIIMFTGNPLALPANWRVCDGTNGTPDLRDRFLVGASATKPKLSAGGSATLTSVPAHAHNAGLLYTAVGGDHNHAVNDPGHRHSVNSRAGVPGGSTEAEPFEGQTQASGATGYSGTGIYLSSAGNHQHQVLGATDATGTVGGVDITPPYYAVLYIIRVS